MLESPESDLNTIETPPGVVPDEKNVESAAEALFLSELKQENPNVKPSEALDYVLGLDLKKDPKHYRTLSRFIVAYRKEIKARYPKNKGLYELNNEGLDNLEINNLWISEWEKNKFYSACVQIIKQAAPLYHLSDEEEVYFKAAWKLSRSKEGEERFKPAMWVRDKYSERADLDFLQSLDSVHWCFNVPALEKALSDPLVLGSDMSGEGYLPEEEIKGRWAMGIGIQMEGTVVWGCNMDAGSDNKYIDEHGFTHKYPFGDSLDLLIMGDDTFLRAEERDSHNELVVTDWNPVAIVVDFNAFNRRPVHRERSPEPVPISEILADLVRISETYNIPLIDTARVPIDLESFESLGA